MGRCPCRARVQALGRGVLFFCRVVARNEMTCYTSETGEGAHSAFFTSLPVTVLRIMPACRATSMEDYGKAGYVATGLTLALKTTAVPSLLRPGL